jgi:hypothetical protein
MSIFPEDEIEKLRSELGDSSDLEETLNILYECDRDLEDTILLIASRAGEPLEMGDSLLERLVEQSRKHLCKPEVRTRWNDIKDVLEIIKEILPPPTPLAITCLFKLYEIGLRNLCESDQVED